MTTAVKASTTYLTKEPRIVGYLHSRGLSSATIASWDIGYWKYPECEDVLKLSGFEPEEIDEAGLGSRLAGRVTLPLLDPVGHPCGLVGRNLPGTQHPVRWLYPPPNGFFHKRSHLIGLHQVLDAWEANHRNIPSTPILVEGPFDVLTAHQCGFMALSTHGTSITNEQALMLRGLHDELIVVPDTDDRSPDYPEGAGRTNFLKAVKRWKSALPTTIRLATLPTNTDPAALLRTDPQAFARSIEEAKILT